MPLRPLNREQAWLLPPTLGELIPDDHPARFVAAFVDSLNRAAWVELGIGPDGDPLGAPAYHPRALLSVWLHGFMTGIRSSRKLEAAWSRSSALPMADGMAASRPQHPLAILSGPPRSDAETTQIHCGYCRGIGTD